MADDLANELLRLPIVGFGTTFGAQKTLTSLLEEVGAELEITLAAKTVLCGNSVNAFGAAFTVDEHGELAGDFIIFGDRQRAAIALDAFFEKLDGNHTGASLRECHKGLINYGTHKEEAQGEYWGRP